MSKMDRVLNVLSTGEELTAKQIQSRFGVGNARATVSALRMKGYPIYANTRTDTSQMYTHAHAHVILLSTHMCTCHVSSQVCACATGAQVGQEGDGGDR